MTELIKLDLAEKGIPCGPTMDLRNVYQLGSYEPEKYRYVITISTSHDGSGESGEMELPVQSVGRSGIHYFFATDYRFLSYPGAECVFPEVNQVRISTESSQAGTVGVLSCRGFELYRSKTRKSVADVMEELAGWAVKQVHGRWDFPREIAEAVAALDPLKGLPPSE